jgi:hypothetical protein
VLSDAALRSIADNLAALHLDPLTHMRVVAALAPALIDKSEPPPIRSESVNGARKPKRRAAAKRGRAAARAKPLPGTPIEIAFEGETYSRKAGVGRASGGQIRAQRVRDHSDAQETQR